MAGRTSLLWMRTSHHNALRLKRPRILDGPNLQLRQMRGRRKATCSRQRVINRHFKLDEAEASLTVLLRDRIQRPFQGCQSGLRKPSFRFR